MICASLNDWAMSVYNQVDWYKQLKQNIKIAILLSMCLGVARVLNVNFGIQQDNKSNI